MNAIRSHRRVLTRRQQWEQERLRIMQLKADGLDNNAIARRIGRSAKSVMRVVQEEKVKSE